MPLQVSSGSQLSPEPLVATTSAGQVVVTPSQVSSGSQLSPEPARQTCIVSLMGAHVPSLLAPAAMLHAWQSLGSPPPQAALQHTPSAQWLLVHSEALEQAVPSAPATE